MPRSPTCCARSSPAENIGLVIAQNQWALDFLAEHGGDLLPPGLPVLSTLVATPPVTGAARRIAS